MGKLIVLIVFFGLCFNASLAQDTINHDLDKEKYFQQIEQRNWRIKVPLWIPGFTGSFAYGGISTYPEEGGYIFIERFEGEIGLALYLIGDVQFRSNNWIFAVDGFHTTLASNLKFQNIDKIQFSGSIEGTIIRGYAGIKIIEYKKRENHLKAALYPYAGFRFFDLRIRSKNSKILDLDPTWFEPVLGLRGGVYYRRWLFEAKADVGGFGINNHWSGFAGLDASYRFSQLFGLGLGWANMNFNYDQEFEFKNLYLEMYLSGPVLSLEFNF